MNRFHGPSAAGKSKATPQTQCQKCLKRDKCFYPYNCLFECTAAVQDRPYASRPSRTQQLANPKLIPKLTSDIPNELLRKKGIADEQFAKEDVERGRKLVIEGPNRSLRSSCSSSSVSTVSTDISRSRRPSAKDRKRKLRELPLSSIQNRENRGNPKRRRSSTRSSTSYSSEGSFRKHCRNRSRGPHRNIRRRRASRSPGSRGRNRHDSRRALNNATDRARKLRQDSSYSSSSGSPDSSSERGPRDGSRIEKFSSGRHSSVSRGREQNFQGKRSNRRSRSHSYSRDRSQVARNRQSMTPSAPPQRNGGSYIRKLSDANTRNRRRRYSNDNDRYGGSLKGPRTSHFSQSQKKERSLSPFSKRVALTQAMNTGR